MRYQAPSLHAAYWSVKCKLQVSSGQKSCEEKQLWNLDCSFSLLRIWSLQRGTEYILNYLTCWIWLTQTIEVPSLAKNTYRLHFGIKLTGRRESSAAKWYVCAQNIWVDCSNAFGFVIYTNLYCLDPISKNKIWMKLMNQLLTFPAPTYWS